MEKALGIFHNGYSSPLPARIKMGSFLALHTLMYAFKASFLALGFSLAHSENLVRFLDVKPMKMWDISKTVAPEVSHCQASPHSSLQQLPSKCSYRFMTPAAPAPSKQISAVTFWIHLSLHILGQQFQFSDKKTYLLLTSYCPRKVSNFYFAQLFLV